MNYWNQFPLFRLILPFIFGIITAIFFEKELSFLTEVLIILFVIVIILAFARKFYLKYQYRWLFGCLVNLIIFLSGYQLTIEKTEKFHPIHFSKQHLHTDAPQGEGKSPTLAHAFNVDSLNVGSPLPLGKADGQLSPLSEGEGWVERWNGLVIANVVDPVIEKQRSIKTIVEVVKSGRLPGSKMSGVNTLHHDGENTPHNELYWLSTNGKAIIYFQKDSMSKRLQYGDQLLIDVRFTDVKPPQNPSEFNYKRYLSFHSIYHQAYINSDNWRLLNKGIGNPVLKYAHSLRNKLLNVFRNNKVEGEEFAVASALILGYKDDLDTELKRAYSSAGAMHVLAVSGLHVGIIYLFMNSLLFFFSRVKYGNIIKAVVLILFLWAYAVLTGLSPSVMRATTMFSFIIFGKIINRYTNIYNTLCASAFLLLLINPFLIVEVGFQLSYAAVFGIILIQPKLYHLPTRNSIDTRGWEPDIPYIPGAGWLLDKIWAIITVSIAAQIATFPLGLLYFHQFPNYFIFSNLIVIPMAVVIIYLGIFLFILSPVSWLSGAMAKAFTASIAFLNGSVKYIEQFPYSLTQGISITILETWLIYILIAFILAFFMINQMKYLRYGLLFFAVFLVFQSAENYREEMQRKFIVYNIAQTSAYDFINGKQNLLIADSSLINNKNKLLFHIKHYWWDNGVENVNMLGLEKMNMASVNGNVFIKNNFLQFYDKRIALIRSHSPLPHREEEFASERQDMERKQGIKTRIKIDYALVANNSKIKITDLLMLYDIGSIIIDSSNSYWKANKWVEECKTLNIKCYSVKHSGAFQVEV
ncbi:MAG: ComEC/Rec2 family competence protein [Bacteroidota bacterium]